MGGALDNLLMNISQWIDEHDLIEKGLRSCRTSLENTVRDEIEAGRVPLNGLSIDMIKLHFQQIHLALRSPKLAQPCFSISIDIYADTNDLNPEDNIQIGDYSLISDTSGNTINDSLVIYKPIRAIVKELYGHLVFALTTPFTARCIADRAISPLRVGDSVEVLAMAPPEECQYEMFVIAHWHDQNFIVPLAQLELISGTKNTQNALIYWNIWDKRHVVQDLAQANA